MRTSDDVRAALMTLEEDAPTVEEVLSRVQRPARPASPRGARWRAVAAATALAAAIAVGVAVVAHTTRGRPDQAACAPRVEPRYEFTMAPVPGLIFPGGSIGQDVQQRDIATVSGLRIGAVRVGGSWIAELNDRRATTVQGQPAYFGEQALVGPGGTANGAARGEWASTVPALAWQYRPGQWLVVRASDETDGPVAADVIEAWGADVWSRLRAVAEAVRVGPSAPLLLPFRLSAVPEPLTALLVRSDVDPRTPLGEAVVAELGVEVTIRLSVPAAYPPVASSAKRVQLGDHVGWVDTHCAVRPAPTSAASANAANPDCGLTARLGRWQLEIFTGGGTPVTAAQFVDIARHLTPAASPTDPATWFPADSAGLSG
jgi:hypothetical protein